MRGKRGKGERKRMRERGKETDRQTDRTILLGLKETGERFTSQGNFRAPGELTPLNLGP